MRRLPSWMFIALVPALSPATAAAQPAPESIPSVVVDVRGALPFLGQSPITAADLGRSPTDLPSRGLGLSGGVTVYPIRRAGFAIGLGGSLVFVRAGRESVPLTDTQPVLVTNRRFDGYSAQLSLNFGHRDGWSYLSGGVGPLTFDTYRAGDSPDGVRAMTLNYGGGARWFITQHLASTFDVRLYTTRPSERTFVVGARAQQTVLVISVGVSVR